MLPSCQGFEFGSKLSYKRYPFVAGLTTQQVSSQIDMPPGSTVL